MNSKVSGASFGAIRKIGGMGARLNAKPPKRAPFGYDDSDYGDDPDNRKRDRKRR